MGYHATDKPYPRGELCMQGNTVFAGYYKRPDITKDAFEDGWFKTGDVCQVYPNGSVKIIDRSKNIFKLSQGEYIAPEKIENIFALSPFVAQNMVYGDSLKNCVVAIIVPDMAKLKQWAADNGKDVDKLEVAAQHADFKKLLMDDLERLGKEKKLSSLEKPKDVYITIEPFSIENNILTPTFKLKRNIGRDVYKN